MGTRTPGWLGPVIAAAILGTALFGAAVKLAPLAEAVRNPFAVRSRTMSGPVLLQQVQKLQRLETSRYQGQVIVEGETKGILPTWITGDRLLFVGRGEVVAGIDLARLREGDLHAVVAGADHLVEGQSLEAGDGPFDRHLKPCAEFGGVCQRPIHPRRGRFDVNRPIDAKEHCGVQINATSWLHDRTGGVDMQPIV